MGERRDRQGDSIVDPQHVAEVRTAIQFLVKGIDRLEGSLDRLQQTVREDFASTGDLEVVKAAVTQLRLDLDRRLTELERSQAEKAKTLETAVDQRARSLSVRNQRDIKIARWFIYVAIPFGALGLLSLAWEAFKAWTKAQAGGP